METIEILRSARALIDAPEKWTKGTEARDAHGFRVRFESPDAVCFCAVGALLGALHRAGNDDDGECVALRRLRKALPIGFADVVSLNDHPDTTHADIMAVFDRAIAAEEAAIKALDTPA